MTNSATPIIHNLHVLIVEQMATQNLFVELIIEVWTDLFVKGQIVFLNSWWLEL